ncbi:MAG: glycogen synthase GlgA [Proteobacteria bacterium]|nr:glycogen synthase GlgA [Pseudomonadota bacterium]
MRVLFVVSEAYPLVKTGGLGDVGGALPAALAGLGAEVRLLLPGYPEARARLAGAADEGSLGDLLGLGEARLLGGEMPGSGLRVWLVHFPPLYERPGGPYLDPAGREWADNHLRFALLARAGAHLAAAGGGFGFAPDVVHANDWQSGLLPAYLKLGGRTRPGSVFTVHNMQFPGLFAAEVLGAIGLPPESFAIDGVEFYGRISFLKAGLAYADRLTTVSPTYAEEIQRPAGGGGLAGLVAKRAGVLTGLVNGVDYRIWDPAKDRLIARRYGPRRLALKAENKRALQREMGLAPEPATPLVGLVSRLTEQKGVDLMLAALPRLLGLGCQLATLGSGEARFETELAAAAAAHPGRVAVHTAYDEALAHRIQAGADICLVPSRFEPCGLVQMYALRYGTVPVVHRTGGLADTVVEVGENGKGTGFLFETPTVEALVGAVARALACYRQARRWPSIQRRGMRQDFGWGRTAHKYMEIYRQLA